MDIYLAARYSRFEEMQGYAKELTSLGHTVVSRWILGDHDIRSRDKSDTDKWMKEWAREDYYDVTSADIIISFTDKPGGRNRGGRHAEFGAGMVSGQALILIGPREHVFHWLDWVHKFDTWEEALNFIEEEYE